LSFKEKKLNCMLKREITEEFRAGNHRRTENVKKSGDVHPELGPPALLTA